MSAPDPEVDAIVTDIHQLEKRVEDAERCHRAWMECALDLHAENERLESLVRALVASHAELQATVKALCHAPEPLDFLKKRNGVWLH